MKAGLASSSPAISSQRLLKPPQHLECPKRPLCLRGCKQSVHRAADPTRRSCAVSAPAGAGPVRGAAAAAAAALERLQEIRSASPRAHCHGPVSLALETKCLVLKTGIGWGKKKGAGMLGHRLGCDSEPLTRLQGWSDRHRHPPWPMGLSLSLRGALCCARDGTGHPPWGKADLNPWAALGPCCAICCWPQEGRRMLGQERCLATVGKGPSLFAPQLLSLVLTGTTCVVCLALGNLQRPLGRKELKSICTL